MKAGTGGLLVQCEEMWGLAGVMLLGRMRVAERLAGRALLRFLAFPTSDCHLATPLSSCGLVPVSQGGLQFYEPCLIQGVYLGRLFWKVPVMRAKLPEKGSWLLSSKPLFHVPPLFSSQPGPVGRLWGLHILLFNPDTLRSLLADGLWVSNPPDISGL